MNTLADKRYTEAERRLADAWPQIGGLLLLFLKHTSATAEDLNGWSATSEDLWDLITEELRWIADEQPDLFQQALQQETSDV